MFVEDNPFSMRQHTSLKTNIHLFENPFATSSQTDLTTKSDWNFSSERKGYKDCEMSEEFQVNGERCADTVLSRGVLSLFGPTRKSSRGAISPTEEWINQSIDRKWQQIPQRWWKHFVVGPFGWLTDWR